LAKISVEFTKSLPNVVHHQVDEGDDVDIDQLLLEAEHEPSTSKVEIKSPAKEIKSPTKIEKVLRIEKISSTEVKDDKEYMQDLCTEERLDDEDNIFGEEIYDIMEIDNEENVEKVYLEDTSNKHVLEHDEESEFILVNFKSSSDDLTDTQFVVEEVTGSRPRKKPSNRLPKEIVDKYAQSTRTNQHICTKCVKVFSTRTNLIRHIQSHDGYKVRNLNST
jgi:hypothetical protein